MRTTTLRIGDDLWALLEAEAARAGVSVSQYIREAALARAAAASGSRGDLPFSDLVRGAREIAASTATPLEKRHAIELALSGLARALSQYEADSAHALRDESRQARRQAKDLKRAPAPSAKPQVKR